MRFDSGDEPVVIWTGKVMLDGILKASDRAVAAVLVANGIGHRKGHPCGERFAFELNRAGFATLLFDLLTADEEQFDSRTGHFRQDAQFQAERLRDVVEWMRRGGSREIPIVVAGMGHVAPGLARLAAEHGDLVQAVILGADRAVPLSVAGQISVPTLVMTSDDDPLTRHHAETIVSALRGPKQLAIAEVNRIGDVPFFSAAAGRLAARWLEEALLAYVIAEVYELV
jgi:putative phosphoribosyl transferase